MGMVVLVTKFFFSFTSSIVQPYDKDVNSQISEEAAPCLCSALLPFHSHWFYFSLLWAAPSHFGCWGRFAAVVACAAGELVQLCCVCVASVESKRRTVMLLP